MTLPVHILYCLSAAHLVRIAGTHQIDAGDSLESRQDSIDVHDDVLNYTFGAREFGAPWGAAASTNAGVGLSLGIFKAKSGSSHEWTRSHCDPWDKHQKQPSFSLQHALEEILVDAANGSNILSIAVFVHGYFDSGKGVPRIEGNVTYGTWPAIAAATYATQLPRNHIGVAVDWEEGASGFYSRAMSTTRVVGLYLSRLMKAARGIFGSKVRTWCVGQSLGAHVCGLAGKYAKLSDMGSWDVISALDPAGPSVTFLRSVSTSWVQPAFTSARLNPNDAAYTEALYTDWGGLGFHNVLAACIDKHHWYANWQFQFCFKKPVRLGHLEAYVNPLNYTATGSFYPRWLPDQAYVQPGCKHSHLFCSHHYSKTLLLFALSQKLQGNAFSLKSVCGAMNMVQWPLDLCPQGDHVQPVQILSGPSTGERHQVGAYSFDGHQAPGVSELALLYPDTQGSAGNVSWSRRNVTSLIV